MTISKTRHGHLTLFGASSNVLTRPVFHKAPSTNKEDTLEFLKQVKANLMFDCKPHRVCDNHYAHKSSQVVAYMDEHFQQLKMPKTSYQFNV